MFDPEQLKVIDGIGRLQPSGHLKLVEVVDLVTDGIGFCRLHKISRLLVDVTKVQGASPPTSIDRFLMAQDWAHAARGEVILAMVALPEHIDPEGFGIKAAADMGLIAGAFTSEVPALEWLATRSD